MRSSHLVLGDLRVHIGATQSLRVVCVQPALGPVAGIVGPSVGEFEAVVDEERSDELARGHRVPSVTLGPSRDAITGEAERSRRSQGCSRPSTWSATLP
jgi:hypothetical protein